MFEATIAGSLPKPGWLAETDKLWPQWKLPVMHSQPPSATLRCSG